MSLQQRLSQITNIDTSILVNSDLMSQISVAKRMSWAANRCTTRVEDLSYCLFGIFDVNLPLIYGEGRKAFIRLQEAIASENNDLSLFAWSPWEQKQCKPRDDLTKGDQHHQLIRGIFATSLSHFSGCGNIVKISNPSIPSKEFTMTNKGFHIITHLGRGNGEYSLDLRCTDVRHHTNKYIHLFKTSDGYVRHDYPRQPWVNFQPPIEDVPVYIPKYISPSDSHIIESRLAHRFSIEVNAKQAGTVFQIQRKPEHLWDTTSNCFVTDGDEQFTGLLNIQFYGGWSTLAPRNCVVFFGLTGVRAPANDQNDSNIRSWAAIYRIENESEISKHLEQEKEWGFPRMIANIGSMLRRRDSYLLPSNLTFKNENTMQPNSIIVSLETRTQKGPNLQKYSLTLNITENCHDGTQPPCY